jgi:hypothetical protein
MLKSGLRVCQAVLPISKIEFLDAISRVCPDALQDGERKLGMKSYLHLLKNPC